ncbi:Ppx/GppA phosphatase family protein [Aliarcobacter trophiarum]|uniref:Ppx/GppA phosphatase family protein n=1 Tax=Aliarcobacter trophiarum TaxID=708186 RepID=UPI00100B006C|nr:exopolyphosphatase [Aliarcobacter trophiarum]RXI24963.1 exopolyphosphatase [Aliarcobacter trophiarum]
MKNEVITIDLGSNSFRVLKYDYLNFKIIDEYHQVTGLADGLIDSGIISFEALNRVVEALCIAKDKLNFNPNNAVCVTTAAMRKAKNSNEALEYIVKNSGAKFKIIDAEEEARLTLLAIKYALKREKIDTQNFTLLDIGGGSTELTISFEDKIYTKSFDFGIVTMTQKALKDGKLFEDLRNQELVIKEFLATLDFSIKDFPFIATAGTPTTIASIKLGYSYFNYDKNVVNGTILDIEDLENSLKLLKEKSLEELVALVGKGRVEYLEIGTYIYRLFFNVLEKSKSIVLDDGLREGVAIDYALSLK